MSKVITIEAYYQQAVGFDVEDMNIKAEDIDVYWIKWGTLYIQKKDGTIHEKDVSMDFEVDWKWPEDTKLFDKNYKELIEGV